MNRLAALTCSLAALAGEGLAAEVVLKKAFVTAHMNRVTLTGSFSVDRAHTYRPLSRATGMTVTCTWLGARQKRACQWSSRLSTPRDRRGHANW